MFEQRLDELKAHVLNSHPKFQDSPLSVESLLDSIIAVYDDCKAFSNADKNGAIPKFLQRFETVIKSLRSVRINKDDFKYIRLLAKGQFGEVSLVRGKFDNKVYAMKALRKSEMLKQADIAFFMEEKQILAALHSPWITQLFASFQDEGTLYLVMDYLPGGDISNLIMKADEGSIVIDEDFARFYIAETLMGLGELHKLNYVHRDLKPGNILLDAAGHVKLADFGSCIQVDEAQGVSSQVTVGTPDYISPEVLRSNEGKGTYGKECDFWSLGITMYEMLVGDPPFYAESLAETYSQIMNYEKHFQIPADVKLSNDAVDLLKRLICDASSRLKTADEIKAHPFFKSIDWQNLASKTAPFVPDIKNDEDVSNFAELDDEDDVIPSKIISVSRERNFAGSNLSFIGYTFTRGHSIVDRLISNEAKEALKGTLSAAPIPQGELDEKLAQVENECENLRKKIQQEAKKTSVLETSQARLETELERLRKALSQEMEKLSQREEQITTVERDRKLVTIELENVQKKYQQTLNERAEFEIRLAEVNATLERESKAGSSVKEGMYTLQQEKAKLEANVEVVNRRLEGQTAELKQLQESVSELTKGKALLDLEIENLKGQLDEEQKAKDSVVQQLGDVENQIRDETSRREVLEESLSDAELTIQELRKSLEAAHNQLEEEIRDRQVLQSKITTIESAKNASEREALSLKLKIEALSNNQPSAKIDTISESEEPKEAPKSQEPQQKEATSETPKKPGLARRASLLFSRKKSASKEDPAIPETPKEAASVEESTARNKHTRRESAPDPPTAASSGPIARRGSLMFKRSNDVSRQLELEVGLRKQANAESAKITAEKLMIESQLREAQTLLHAAKQDLAESKKMVKLLEEKSIEKKGRLSGRLSNTSQHGSEIDLANLDTDTRGKLERKLADLKKAGALAAIEMTDMRKKYNDEVHARESMEAKVFELEQNLAENSQAKFLIEGKLKELESTYEIVVRDFEMAKMEIKNTSLVRQQQDEALDKQAKKLALTEAERDEMQQKLQTTNRRKAEIEAEVESLRARIDELLGSHIDPEEFTALADECNRFHKELIDMTLKYDELNLKYRRAANDTIGRRTDNTLDSPALPRNSSFLVSTDDMESIDNSKRARMNNTKMKGLEQQLSVEVARRSAAETELTAVKQTKSILENEIEDLRKQIANLSSSDKQSQPSTIARTSNFEYSVRKLRPILFPDSSKPVIQGWLRIRVAKNSKKTKFDWLKRYAIVRDHKIFLCEKEKDKDSQDIKHSLDMRADFITVRRVEPSELIHLPAKDVSSVFSINVLTDSYTSLMSLDNIAGQNELPEQEVWKKRLQAVEKTIEKEVHFKEATEKMIKVTSSTETKKKYQNEIEESVRRYKILKAEKTDVEKALKQIEIASQSSLHDNPTIMVEDEDSLALSREIEKKEAYKRGMENMLEVTKNSETKSSLSHKLREVSQDLDVLRSSMVSLDQRDDPPESTVSKIVKKSRLFEQSIDSIRMASMHTTELTGTTYLMALDEADCGRWIAGIDCVRTNVSEVRQERSNDIDSLLNSDI